MTRLCNKTTTARVMIACLFLVFFQTSIDHRYSLSQAILSRLYKQTYIVHNVPVHRQITYTYINIIIIIICTHAANKLLDVVYKHDRTQQHRTPSRSVVHYYYYYYYAYRVYFYNTISFVQTKSLTFPNSHIHIYRTRACVCVCLYVTIYSRKLIGPKRIFKHASLNRNINVPALMPIDFDLPCNLPAIKF